VRGVYTLGFRNAMEKKVPEGLDGTRDKGFKRLNSQSKFRRVDFKRCFNPAHRGSQHYFPSSRSTISFWLGSSDDRMAVAGSQRGDPSQESRNWPLTSTSNTLSLHGISADVRYSKRREDFSTASPVSSHTSRRIASSADSHGDARPPGNEKPRPSLRSTISSSGPFRIMATEAGRNPKIGMRE
jgi:hypothetical protein